MPIGSFDLAPILPFISNPALQLLVQLFDADPDEGGIYLPLYNVWCDSIQEREGVDPPVARFHYLTDNTLFASLGWPAQYEQLFPIGAMGNYIVQNDDRLVVMAQTPQGNPFVLFDGFAQIPEAQVSGPAQPVSFTAIGVAIRAFDTPVVGRVQRDANAWNDTTGDYDFRVGLPVRFNPSDTSIGSVGGYIGNSVTTENSTVDDSDDDIGNYAVFLEPLLVEENLHGVETAFWFVSDAVGYLIADMILEYSLDDYIMFPTLATIGDLLSAQEPPPGGGILNPGDAVQTDIKIRDYDATNKPYPDVIAELMGYCGFVLRWQTDTDQDGFPQTSLVFSRRDGLATATPKSVYHAAYGATQLDPSANNVTQIAMARDSQAITNQWQVETGLKQVEVTVYLAPLFVPQGTRDPPTGDYDSQAYTTKALQQATTQSGGTAGAWRDYRWYGVDECGTGWFNQQTATWVTEEPCDFSSIFPDSADGVYGWVERYRPGSNTLISKDTVSGKPLKKVLEVQFGVNSSQPGLPGPEGFDSQTNWLAIPNGWELLDDRLGIRVNCPNPNEWHTGNPAIGVIRGINWSVDPELGAPNGPTKQGENFALRLTTVIDSDQRIPVTATKRIASPTQFTRQRSADAKDHFQYCSIDLNSRYYTAQGGNGTDPFLQRDDTKDATTHAGQLRTAHEMPPLAGSLKIPFITDFYEIGDRINNIVGRNCDLTTNVGIDQGESPVYPWVVARTWNFSQSRQETVLQLTDRRAERTNL